jgi:hypothetical protein
VGEEVEKPTIPASVAQSENSGKVMKGVNVKKIPATLEVDVAHKVADSMTAPSKGTWVPHGVQPTAPHRVSGPPPPTEGKTGRLGHLMTGAGIVFTQVGRGYGDTAAVNARDDVHQKTLKKLSKLIAHHAHPLAAVGQSIKATIIPLTRHKHNELLDHYVHSGSSSLGTTLSDIIDGAKRKWMKRLP